MSDDMQFIEFLAPDAVLAALDDMVDTGLWPTRDVAIRHLLVEGIRNAMADNLIPTRQRTPVDFVYPDEAPKPFQASTEDDDDGRPF